MITMRKWAVAALLLAGFAACKKDDPKPDPKPDPIETVNLTITELRAKSTAASVTIGETKKLFKVKGVILSDNSSTGKNIDAKTAVLVQENNAAGIIVNFTAAHSFAAGTEMEIGISNQKLEQVDGEIVLNAIPLDSAKSTASGKAIAAKETTIENILANKTALDGTLVKIAATELTSADGKFNGTLTLKDASGELTSQILSGASFSGDALLPSVSALTGIVRISGDKTRIDIRKVDDVVVGDITKVLVEDFDNLTGSAVWIEQGLPNKLVSSFSTTFSGSGWVGSNWTFKYQGDKHNDGSFTVKDKYYPYLFPNNKTNGYISAENFTGELKGLKTIKITFAGSNATKLYGGDNIDGFDTYDLYTFKQGTDKLQIRMLFGNGLIEKLSPQYDKLGEWYTVSFTVPTKAELIAAGMSESSADLLLEYGWFQIWNNSSPRTGVVNGVDNVFATWQPILIQKVEFGF